MKRISARLLSFKRGTPTIVPLPPEPPNAREPLARQFGLTALWLLVINGMIGGGIFGVPAKAEQLAGAFSPWVFVLCALLIAPIMLCFAQLSSAFGGTGGPMLYVQTAFGPFAGFQVGWAFYIARLTAFAANLSLLVTTLAYFWPGLSKPLSGTGLQFALCGLMIWVNVVDARTAMRSLGALTLFKLFPLLALAGFALVGLDREVFTSIASLPDHSDLAASVLLVIYAFVGFESGLVPAGESKNPQRDMPRALLLALAVAAGIYVFVQIGAQQLLPDLAKSERPIVDAGQALLGTTGALIVVVAIVASVGGNLVGSMFSTPRVTYRLALDGQLPAIFGSVHSGFQTPWFSIVVFGAAAFVLSATGSFVWLAGLSVLTRLLIYVTCIASMPRVQKTNASAPSLFKLPGGPTIPLLGLLVCIALLSSVTLPSVIATMAMLTVGTLLFWIASRKRRRLV